MGSSKKIGNYSTPLPCTARNCITENGNTFHHIKTRGSHGGEQEWNRLPLCLSHHNECHDHGLIRFSRNYVGVFKWLLNQGWYIEDIFGREKWMHPDYWKKE